MLDAGLVAIDGDRKWVGGRYYLHHLVRCVSALPPDERVSLHAVSWMQPQENDPFAEVAGLMGPPIVVAPPSGFVGRAVRKLRRSLSGSVDARDLFDATGIDVFFPIPPCDNSGTNYVFWLSDFQYKRRPDLFTPQRCEEIHAYFAEHVAGACRVVVSSEDARRDFAGVFPEFLDKTDVVRFCSVPDEEWWELDPATVAAEHGLPERYLIVCNQFTRHKNHLMLMEAVRIASVAGNDVQLVCTGSTFDHRGEDCVGQVEAFLATHGLGARVHILGLVPRNEQIALLRRALAVVQPSWFEGWSTIVEDAKTLGKPLLVSDLPVHREQLGDGHEYLPVDDSSRWADAIAQAWSTCAPGPDPAQEAAGLAALEIAKQACGRAFVHALKSAVRRPE